MWGLSQPPRLVSGKVKTLKNLKCEPPLGSHMEARTYLGL